MQSRSRAGQCVRQYRYDAVIVSLLDSSGSLKGINREQSVEVIHLDVLRTFPTLGFFQEVLYTYDVNVRTVVCLLLSAYATHSRHVAVQRLIML